MKNKLNTLTLPESQLTSAQVQDGPSNLTSLHPWFITGFSDAEGCFGIQIPAPFPPTRIHFIKCYIYSSALFMYHFINIY